MLYQADPVTDSHGAFEPLQAGWLEVPPPPNDKFLLKVGWEDTDRETVGDVWRPVAQADKDKEKESMTQYENMDPMLVSLMLCINDGTIVPGANATDASLQAALAANLPE